MNLTIIQQKIYEVRGLKVMLDFDLADLYNVETKVLNQTIKRNKERFPDDFMFQLNPNDWFNLRSQIVTLKKGWGKHSKYLPFAFTEHGVAMLASVLRSETAVNINIVIIKAFIALRQMALQYKDLAEKLLKLEKQYNKKFKDVYQALNFLMEQNDFSKRERIGFKKR
jgi:phage regulator Rha-like protein